MLRAIAGGIIRLAMLVVALVLVVDVLYFVHGSRELFPTEEQQETVRQVTGVAGAVLAFVQVGLWLLLRRLGSTSASPAPPVVGSPDDAGGQG